ncbi:MAG TPA: hypothetical protein VGZ29_02045 [Terriglobia bacterium]|nr:hypothetical protein [Terriglobia bacterium]
MLIGAILLAASLSLASGEGARVAARLLGAALVLDFVIVHIPRMADAPGSSGVRGLAFETLSVAAIAFVLAPMAASPRSAAAPRDRFPGLGATVGRYLFAVSLVVFAFFHFMLIPLVASLIPAWIPGRVFLAYFTGAGFIAAALAIATGKLARLAGILLGAMFLIFVVTLHVPRVAHAIGSADEWTSLLVAVAMAGGGFIVAGLFSEASSPSGYLAKSPPLTTGGRKPMIHPT